MPSPSKTSTVRLPARAGTAGQTALASATAAAATAADAERLAQRIALVRAFNRFYTRHLGVLDEQLLGSGFSLAESRVIWELAVQPEQTAAELARQLQLDPGYLSRLLKGLKARKLLLQQPDASDARQQRLRLSAAGQRARAPLEQRAQDQVAQWLQAMPDASQRQLLGALNTLQSALQPERSAAPQACLIRPHRPGDLGWIVSAHGALYAQEYGWDITFEALVARIAADFIDRFDPRREACWIAERPGPLGEPEPLGCVMLVQCRDDATGAVLPGVAQLRLLIVHPRARGLGLGARLVAECEAFAIRAGYQRIRLWTQSILTAARAIYAGTGYRLVATEPHHSFGHDLVGEIWERDLPARPGPPTPRS